MSASSPSQPPTTRPAVKIVVAVWGSSYIDRFARLGLGSMLAPGNLPAVADVWDIEMVILTTSADFPTFEALDLLAQARRYVTVRYEAIDDLLTGSVMSATLTLAFMRGLRTAGERMPETRFIFWNADFVLSDGAFTAIARRLAAGQRVILAGSLRVVSEDVFPRLLADTDAAGVLSIGGREMTRLALEHPHALQTAKLVDHNGAWATSPNHMFWSAGPGALVARYWQIFMLCIAPTRRLERIDGYCDYSFAPALCPGEPEYVVEDSDELCLLELQGRDQDHEPVSHGPARDAAWAENVQEWCTREHARVARQPIVFHADGRPREADDVIAASGRYVERLLHEIGPRPSHRGHYYWVSGIAHWNAARPGVAPPPPELDDTISVADLKHPSNDRVLAAWAAQSAAPPSPIRRFQQMLVGAPEAPRALHPDGAALAAVAEAVRGLRERIDSGAADALVIAPPMPWLDRLLPPNHERLYRVTPMAARTWRLQPCPPVVEIMIYLRAEQLEWAPAILSRTAPALRRAGRATLIVHAPAYRPAPPAWCDDARRAYHEVYEPSAAISAQVGPDELAYARRVGRIADRQAGRIGPWEGLTVLVALAHAAATRPNWSHQERPKQTVALVLEGSPRDGADQGAAVTSRSTAISRFRPSDEANESST